MKTAMILAAGRGERLRPLTDKIPKALCCINGVPLIEYHIQALVRAGVERIVINHAYLGGQIRHHVGCGKRFNVEILYAPEPPGGLETGGGLFNALPLLGDQPFFAVNADIFTDYNFIELKLPPFSSAHLVLVNKPAYYSQGDFGLLNANQLDNGKRRFTFTGIACYHPKLFELCKPGRYSITPILRQLVEAEQVTGEVYSGRWSDIGTLKRLHSAQTLIFIPRSA